MDTRKCETTLSRDGWACCFVPAHVLTQHRNSPPRDRLRLPELATLVYLAAPPRPLRRLPLPRLSSASRGINGILGVRDLMEISLVVEALRIPGLVARLLADLAGAWASVALFVAGFAAFLGFLSRSKIPRVGYSRSRSVISLPSFCYFTSDDDDDIDSESPSDDEEDNDEAPSSPSPSSSSGEYESVSDWGHEGGLELAMSGAVVRTWEGLGVGFGHSGGQISLMDLDRGEVLRSFHAQAPAAAASLASPAVVVSAAEGPTAVRVWDARAAGERTPAAAVEWRSIRQRRVVGVAGGEGRVYVGGDDGVITAADLRRGRSRLVVEAWRGGRWPVLPSPSE